MRALVVDPDRTSRAVMKRLLSHVNVEVAEAENGLVALNLLEQVDPDFIVFEIEMPILGGADMLSAIRQSPVRPDVPAICVTGSGGKDDVMRMVALGVADYLVKPINPVDALPRVKNLVLRAAQWRQRQSSRDISGMLLVDADPNFLAFVKPLLAGCIDIVEAASSTQAAIVYRDATRKPTVVCLAEGLPLMSEDLLADVIRKMAVERGTNPPQFFLITRSEQVGEEKRARYSGVVRKSFVPAQFVEEFRRVVLREQSPYEKLRYLVREGLQAEVVTAAQQTLGVMMGCEIAALGVEAADTPRGVEAVLTIGDASAGAELILEITSGRAEVEKIGAQIMRRPVTFEEGASEVLAELVNTIAGRIRANLISRGFDLRMGLPSLRADAEAIGAAPPDGAAPAEPDLASTFECASGERFRVALFVRQAGAGLGAAEASAGDSETGSAALDDVLF